MEKSKKNVYVTKELVKEINIDDLDFILYDQFNFNYEDFDSFIEIEKGSNYAEASLIKIESIINQLQKLKKRGTTHVSINANCDHHGYDIYAFKLNLSTQEEIDEHEKEHKKYLDKKKKIEELEAQIKQIKNS